MTRLQHLLLRRVGLTVAAALATLVVLAPPAASAQERLCDTSFENCRVPLIDLIRNETVGIDVAFWFMTDSRYTTELIRRFEAGVPVRVLVDTRANATYPLNADRLKELADAGIPMRRRTASGILHWKMMLFAGQNRLQFSAANYSSQAFVPVEPYLNYTDEAVYFTDDPNVVNSFKTKYDDLWTNTSAYKNYANVSGTLQRHYPSFSKDPELNFPPAENFRTRSVSRYNAEKQRIDAIMFRITDRAHTDALINALDRGVPVRLITDYGQYTNVDRLWHSWNVDRLYKAGAQVRWAGEKQGRSGPSTVGHRGTVHQKSTLLYGQGMTIFGSSNWTSPSATSQEEHNYFTTKGWFFTWFRNQFERKWNNQTGNIETEPFVPLPPDRPTYVAPADGATGLSDTVKLEWYGGPWAHVYDIYLGTTSDPPLLVANLQLGPSRTTTETQSYTVSGLAPGTTYYWRVESKTMADVGRSRAPRSFTTSGTAPAPPPTGGSGWSTRDIGSVGVTGSASESNGTITVHGSGADIWGTADAFRFVYWPLSGDGEVVARVTGLERTHDWAKAGVMIRESLTAGSRHAYMLVSAARGLAFQRRTSTGGTSAHTDGGSGGTPNWVRLVRRGNVFETYRSGNGSSWTLVGSQSISMGSSVYAGLAVTSHNNSVTTRATFDNVRVSALSSSSSGWSTRDIGSVGVTGSASETSGTIAAKGSGDDIWGTADAFRYVYWPLSGDGEVVARVTGLDFTHEWAKAGVMFRESLTAGSRHAFMLVSAGRGLAFQRRTSTGGTSTHTDGGSGGTPNWVRLVRRGNTFEAYRSGNGSSWTLVGSQSISMASSVYAGLAVTSHNNGALAQATFDNVRVSTQSASSDTSGTGTWANRDIGSVALPGEAGEAGGVVTVRASGDDIWGTADAFHYVYRTLSGDGRIAARVTRLDQTHRWAKAGVMIRESLTAGSRHAFMLVSAAQGLAFQRRTAEGGESTHTAGGSGSVPAWVKLVREGDVLSAFKSTSGSTWTLVGQETIPMASSVYVGLAVTSHDNGSRTTAEFDNVAAG